MPANREIQLLEQLRGGDEQAFKLLFDSYFVPLCRFMKLYLKDEAEIEEIATDIFMHIWTNRRDIEIRLSIQSYLFRAARNSCLNALRNNKQTCLVDELSETLTDTHTVDAGMELEELNRLIEEAVCYLPDKSR